MLQRLRQICVVQVENFRVEVDASALLNNHVEP